MEGESLVYAKKTGKGGNQDARARNALLPLKIGMGAAGKGSFQSAS